MGLGTEKEQGCRPGAQGQSDGIDSLESIPDLLESLKSSKAVHFGDLTPLPSLEALISREECLFLLLHYWTHLCIYKLICSGVCGAINLNWCSVFYEDNPTVGSDSWLIPYRC